MSDTITWQQLKDELETLTPEQLQMRVKVAIDKDGRMTKFKFYEIESCIMSDDTEPNFPCLLVHR